MLVRWHIVVAQERGIDMDNKTFYDCVIYPDQIFIGSYDIFEENVPIKDWLHNIVTDAVKSATKRGEWILECDEKYDVDYYVCSECGYEPKNKLYLTKYCPNCGSEMKEITW